jgi:hypothetical protein
VSTHAPSRRTAGEVARIPWEQLGSVRVGLVFWGGLALLDLGTLAHVPSYAELGAVALLVVAGAVGMRTATAVCAAGVGWLLVDGFVEHRYGVLGFDARTDLARLALLTGLALLATRVRR